MEYIDGFSDPNKDVPSRSDLQKLMPEQAPMQVVTEGFAPKPGYKGRGAEDASVMTVPFYGMAWNERIKTEQVRNERIKAEQIVRKRRETSLYIAWLIAFIIFIFMPIFIGYFS